MCGTCSTHGYEKCIQHYSRKT